MHGAEQIMWAIASLLACWSLAVFFRVLDERRFFRKHPGSPVPRVGAKWAWRAALLALIGAIGTGWFAVWFAKAVPSGRNTSVGAFHVAGGASALFAVSCGFLWAIGDRSRGRRRCGRCWYDMADVPGRRCPECGHEPKAEQGLFRPRRARWQIASAVVLLIAGSAMLTLAARSTGPGLLQSTPSWVIVRGWRFAPDGWFQGEDGSLSDRFEHMGDDPSTIDTGEILVAVLANHRSARDRKAMWDAASSLFYGANNYSGQRVPTLEDLSISYPRQTDLNALAATIISERIDRLSDNIGQPSRSDDLSGYWASHITDVWIAARMIENGQLTPEMFQPYWYRSNPVAEATIRSEVLRTADITLPADFHTLIDHPRQAVRDEYLALMMTLGEYGIVLSNAGVLLESDTDIGYRMFRFDLFTAARNATEAERAAFYDMLIRWVESGTLTLARAAVRFSNRYHNAPELWGFPPGPDAERLRDAILRVAADTSDQRRDDYNNPVRGFFVQSLLNTTYPAETTFPIIRGWLLLDPAENQIDLYWYEEPEDAYSAWIKHFADLADHPEVALRHVCAATAPTTSESLDDTRIDDILERLADDYDDRVVNAAWSRRTDRREARRARDPAQAVESGEAADD